MNSYNDCSEMNFPLSGQFVENSPGFKTVYKAKKSGLNFTTLLEKISTVNQEMRIRFISPHPKDFPLEVYQNYHFINFQIVKSRTTRFFFCGKIEETLVIFYFGACRVQFHLFWFFALNSLA